MVLRQSVERPLWRALTGYRLLATGYALAVFAWAYDRLAHPMAGALYLGLLTVWTLATIPNVLSARRCTKAFLAVDVAMAVAGILGSVYVDAEGNIGPTLPSIWVAGPVLAFAIKGGWRWGAVAATVVGIANILERGAITRPTLHNVLLVCVASIGIGYVIEVARASERTLAHALQIEAATRERERLARDIHDSVLQVLAMVQRRGNEIGGEAAELGRMAGEQEVALRSLVSREKDGTREARARAAVPAQAASARDVRASAASGRDGSLAGRPGGGADGGSNGKPGGRSHGRRGGAADGGGEPGGGREPGGASECDLRALLSPYSGARVTFVEPGAPVPLPASAAREVAAAVSAALDNVRQHAGGPDGEEAQAWILLEDEPDAVLVTVRDDGPGVEEGRLADAEAEGRMGVALSIRGRLRDLGGSAELVSVPGQGTEVELRVPKRPGGRGN
jgi:signal transduction histidine kinase